MPGACGPRTPAAAGTDRQRGTVRTGGGQGGAPHGLLYLTPQMQVRHAAPSLGSTRRRQFQEATTPRLQRCSIARAVPSSPVSGGNNSTHSEPSSPAANKHNATDSEPSSPLANKHNATDSEPSSPLARSKNATWSALLHRQGRTRRQ